MLQGVVSQDQCQLHIILENGILNTRRKYMYSMHPCCAFLPRYAFITLAYSTKVDDKAGKILTIMT